MHSDIPEAASTRKEEEDKQPKQLPKGVVLGPDGKPCRSCTSFASWAAMTKRQTSSSKAPMSTAATLQPPQDCPADVEELGRATWTLLHSLAANYPTDATPEQQSDAKQFMSSFSRLYPCWVCADDFRAWMKEGNEPKVSNREEFGKWLCDAHNAVNVKLGKKVFDCNLWEERWRTGWKDGRCG
ncbi:augmenter of liver regeneration [Piedraia hortae CBS 480.64]|uniref:Sulfhydryl oxidase n=1 Tax=Piedraia hortae CBS 480.64 TaxID=1314780 RepID=A0A6A7C7D8_9PEZI|nr:augmenter of liver regeneration [Piedraia hortae CBS 480.64]